MTDLIDTDGPARAESAQRTKRAGWPATAKVLTSFLALCTAAVGVFGATEAAQVQNLQQAAAVASQKVSNQQTVIVQLHDKNSELASTNETLTG